MMCCPTSRTLCLLLKLCTHCRACGVAQKNARHLLHTCHVCERKIFVTFVRIIRNPCVVESEEKKPTCEKSENDPLRLVMGIITTEEDEETQNGKEGTRGEEEEGEGNVLEREAIVGNEGALKSRLFVFVCDREGMVHIRHCPQSLYLSVCLCTCAFV
eukprot:c18888_g1_i2 orf=331-804(+)